MKIKESEKTKVVEDESDGDTNYNQRTWNGTKRLEKGARRVGNRRSN